MRVVQADEAAQSIIAAVSLQPVVRMALADTVGHILGEDVLAPVALPPWTNASMDGYAVRADDIAGATADDPRSLDVIGAIAAGAFPRQLLQTGEAARIFTGAALPAGADSVVRQEDTYREGSRVYVQNTRDANANVRVAGGDLALGALALPAGTAIGPHQLALLAAVGVTHPVVHRRPRVGILSTGDEIVSLDRPEEILAGRKLGDVNAPALAALVEQAGGIPVPLGISHDDPRELQRIIAAATDIDLVITAGGVSVGDHDHVRQVMASFKVTLVVERVRIRPGGPTAFGMFPDGRAWLGLPGNPVSAMVTFELFGRPAIRAMAGHRDPFRRRIWARLQRDARRDSTLDQYFRCSFEWAADGGPPTATLTGHQGSGMLMSMARAHGLVIVPAGPDTAPAGSILTALQFD